MTTGGPAGGGPEDDADEPADGAVRWEDAYRSPAARPAPQAPSSGVRRGRGGPEAGGEQPPPTPAWGTPDGAPGAAPAAGPDTRPAPQRQGGAGTGVFRVLVEQNVGNGGDYRWAVEPVPTLAYPTREAARDGALEACRRLEPKHPFSEQRRRVFRITPDEYLVTVDGLTTAFHFRVSVGEEIG
ncbi:hypothetical protein [Kineosporia sp. R_H_3]|uniref:hypothetical protein n=1 Tax=Kineosporia sp. R_H_3 TaxID=1961848 RepID=UPI000B4BB773|nr:hypothetical protein [Kineosporia sp. R_H_3]